MSHRSLSRDSFFFGNWMFSPIFPDMEGCCNKVFSSQAMSHCYKLWYRAFGASFLFVQFSLHLIQIFVIITQNRKDNFINKHKQFIQIVFLSHTAISILTCLPWWPSHSPGMHLSYQGCFCSKCFDIFLRGSYPVNVLLETLLFWTFWTF